VFRELSELHEVLGEEDVHDAHEEVGVRAGADEVMLCRLRRGPRAARVDDDDAPAARADGAELPLHVRRRHQAAVRDERIGAEDEQVVGAVDVRDRDAERRAEHEPGRDLLRHLVDGARGVDVPRAERAEERARIEHELEVVGGGIAHVDGDGVAPVVLQDARDVPVDLGERVVPCHLVPGRVAADHRGAKPIGIAVERGQRRALGADVAVRQHVVVVAADAGDLAAAGRDREPAGGFAERTRAEMGALVHGRGVRGRRRRCNGGRGAPRSNQLNGQPGSPGIWAGGS
jgi:hypothetical protein